MVSLKSSGELSSEWEAWVAENLVMGATQDEIRLELVEEGVEISVIDHLLDALCKSPLFRVSTELSARALRSEMILRLQTARASLFRLESRPSLPSEIFHSHYRATNCPVLLPGFASDWPALRRWSMEWLREQHGCASIEICDRRDSDPEYDRNAKQLSTNTTIAELVDRIASSDCSNDFYAVARNRNLQSSLQELWQDIEAPPGYLVESADNRSAALWIGPSGTITPLHHDTSDILFCQIVGRKKIRLIAPHQLQVAAAAKGLYGPSLSEIDDTVVIHDIELGPGETLFIPVGWWHHVTALSPSISVAINAFEDNSLSWYCPGAPPLK